MTQTITDTRPRIAAIQRATMLDWPGRLAVTVFLSGCPLSCPFCHNSDLLTPSQPAHDVESLMAFLHGRRDWIDGIVISGGEPTADPALTDFIGMLSAAGFPVRLDTNGTNPAVLARLIDAGLLSSVALDVKALPERYTQATGGMPVWHHVAESVGLILASGIDHEFRTTCCPSIVELDDLPRIASLLAGGRSYVLQQFRPAATLDPSCGDLHPYAPRALDAAAQECSTYLPTSVRGI